MSQTTVEVFVLSGSDGYLRYRRLHAGLSQGAYPDDVARTLSGLTACTPGAVLHSTSWRYEHGGAIVLTYAALPDPHADLPSELVLADAMTMGAPLAPSPARLAIDAVATHACRHLARLAVTDCGISVAAKARPDLWEYQQGGRAQLRPGNRGRCGEPRPSPAESARRQIVPPRAPIGGSGG